MTARTAPPAPFPPTRIFHYAHAPVRARVLREQAVWFLRDLAVATGAHPAPGLPTVLPGIATTDEACQLLADAGADDIGALRTWLDETAGQLAAPPARRLQSVPHPRPAHIRRQVA